MWNWLCGRKFLQVRQAAAFLAALLAFGIPAQNESDIAALYRDRKFTEAAQALERRLEQRPEDFSSRLLLGLCYQQAGEAARAEQVFHEAVRRRPEHADARFFLARMQYLQAGFTEAQKNAGLSIKLGGPTARAYNLLGLVQAELHRNEEALRAYDAAVRADRHFNEAYLNAGVLLLKLGRTTEALNWLTSAVQVKPDSGEARYHRARAYLELGKRAEAEEDLSSASSVGHYDPARRLLDQLSSGGVAAKLTEHRPPGSLASIRFRNVARQAGLNFILENEPTPRKYLIETMAGGVAAFDYNNDGLTDIYFTNGAAIPSLQKISPKYFNRLYRNEGNMKFTDVTGLAGVAGAGYSIGVAAADYNNDGYVDLFVAGVNRNILFRNNGNGTFEDVAAKAGIQSGAWAVAAGWFDYDNDGALDLFVVNYLKWATSLDRYCGKPGSGVRVYCHPRHLDGLPNVLYRNQGNGTFEIVSDRAGVASHIGKGMSVAFADYDLDGRLDVFVTNDTTTNFLFHNRGNGSFEERALQAGVGLTDDGEAVSSMGVDFRDYDNDGLPDVAVTALSGETFPLFRNQGKGFFRDSTYASRIGLLSSKKSGWGNGLFDFNNDGWKDLFSANSHVTDNIDLLGPYHYRQSNSVFANLGDGTFRDVSGEVGAEFQIARAHRGCAFADFDNDGRMDIVVTSLRGPAELWQNVSPGDKRWIRLRLQGTQSNRDGIGTRVRIGGQHNHMTTSVGYASSSHAGVHFGMGTVERIDRMEIRWPSGVVQILQDVLTSQLLLVHEPAR